MGFPVSKPPPPPPSPRRIDPGWRAMFDSDEEMEMWEGMTPAQRRTYLFEDEWNAKQDRVSYFWKVAIAIVIAAAIAVAML